MKEPAPSSLVASRSSLFKGSADSEVNAVFSTIGDALVPEEPVTNGISKASSKLTILIARWRD